jgi:dipeptidyl aminopeptidase/acylaminoacyl peptidase
VISTDGQSTQLTDTSVAEIKSHANAPEWISYPAHDGLQIPAALFRPLEKSRAPAIVFIHGGPNFQFAEFYYPLPQILSQEGYVVLLPNFRGSTGYGSVFREANFREWGHADAMDVIEGARWLQRQGFVDPNRIAVVGPSYGGYLTLCALTLAPEIFCAGVDMYGDSELVEAYRHEDREMRMDMARHMGTPEENSEGYRRGSPLYSAERIQAPLLILHGKDDMLVVPLMSEKMIEQLKIENKSVEAHFYEGEEHGFEKPENKKDVWERIVRFLNRHCKGEKET